MNKLGNPFTPQNMAEAQKNIESGLKKLKLHEIKAIEQEINKAAQNIEPPQNNSVDKIYEEQNKLLNKNQPKPRHFKTFNAQLTLDNKSNSIYIFVPPNMTKAPIAPDQNELIRGEFGDIHIDYKDGKIIGIEIWDADKYFELK
jgi:uncharacterized protein YuzE